MAAMTRRLMSFVLALTISGLASRFATAQTVDPAAIIERIAADIPESIVSQRSKPQRLEALMTAQKIPAVSVAVFRDGQLAWAHAWGTTDTVAGTPALSSTLFQAASISKPVAAFGAMTMVADGSLSLDKDISQSIIGWQVGSPITMRQLLSHSSGLGVSGFDGYEVGKPLPNVLQILNGQQPANSRAVVLEGQPGVAFNYSGGGFTALQALMMQTASKPFDVLMQDRVLGPLSMTESRFSQPLPANLVGISAKGHQNGIPIVGGAHIYPELAAAGLWTTPRDLGKVAVSIQNALRGMSDGPLTPDSVRQILTPQVGGYGLGFGLETLHGQAVFKHRGLNEGFETYLVASAADKGPSTVIVVMTNGQGGSKLADGMVRAVARDYKWVAYAPQNVVETRLNVRQLREFEGLYRAGDTAIAIEMVDNVLYVRDGNWIRAPMIPTGRRQFSVQNRSIELAFLTAESANSPLQMRTTDSANTNVLERSVHPFGDLGTQAPLLRGTMNEWGGNAVFSKTGQANWVLTMPLPAGNHEFKIASADWTILNLGGPLGNVQVGLNRPTRLAPMGENLKLELQEATTIRFEIDASDQHRALLKVTTLPR